MDSISLGFLVLRTSEILLDSSRVASPSTKYTYVLRAIMFQKISRLLSGSSLSSTFFFFFFLEAAGQKLAKRRIPNSDDVHSFYSDLFWLCVLSGWHRSNIVLVSNVVSRIVYNDRLRRSERREKKHSSNDPTSQMVGEAGETLVMLIYTE